MDIARLYTPPTTSCFLFGPRGVGKSTWVRSAIDVDFEIDLLSHKSFLELQRDPSLLSSKVKHLGSGATVFIDEIQKLPELLDETHRLMERQRLKFILTGSSARKLRRSGANLLAGRAHTYKMFPFCLKELAGRFDIEEVIMSGSLPIVLRDLPHAEETLNSYVETYLREEIKEEALVRRVEEFSRFLEVAGRLNAQVLSYQNVARESGKAASSIQNWYQILEETLLGFKIYPYRPGFKVREAGHPKFYWFDPGVARVASGQSRSDVDSLWLGTAFETVILNELQVYLEVTRKKHAIHYYSTPGAGEVDFIIETRKKTLNRAAQFVSIEVKHTKSWKRDFEGPSRSLKAFAGASHQSMLGVYLGDEVLHFEGFEVLPLQAFVDRLHSGDLL